MITFYFITGALIVGFILLILWGIQKEIKIKEYDINEHDDLGI